MPPAVSQSLLNSRKEIVAKSFYNQLKDEGFSVEQIIDLSTTLISLVTADIENRASA
jgi:hypothetical protein